MLGRDLGWIFELEQSQQTRHWMPLLLRTEFLQLDRLTDWQVEWRTAAAAAAVLTMGASQTRAPHKYQDLADKTGCKWKENGSGEPSGNALPHFGRLSFWNQFVPIPAQIYCLVIWICARLLNCCDARLNLPFVFKVTLAPPWSDAGAKTVLFFLSSAFTSKWNETNDAEREYWNCAVTRSVCGERPKNWILRDKFYKTSVALNCWSLRTHLFSFLIKLQPRFISFISHRPKR